MSSLTIRNLEPQTKNVLRRRAAAHGRSMQGEARTILRSVLNGSKGMEITAQDEMPPHSGESLYRYIRSIIEPIGGGELDLPPRDYARDLPRFE